MPVVDRKLGHGEAAGAVNEQAFYSLTGLPALPTIATPEMIVAPFRQLKLQFRK